MGNVIKKLQHSTNYFAVLFQHILEPNVLPKMLSIERKFGNIKTIIIKTFYTSQTPSFKNSLRMANQMVVELQ